MYGMTPMGVFFTAIFLLKINEQALCQQPQFDQKRINLIAKRSVFSTGRFLRFWGISFRDKKRPSLSFF